MCRASASNPWAPLVHNFFWIVIDGGGADFLCVMEIGDCDETGAVSCRRRARGGSCSILQGETQVTVIQRRIPTEDWHVQLCSCAAGGRETVPRPLSRISPQGSGLTGPDVQIRRCTDASCRVVLLLELWPREAGSPTGVIHLGFGEG
ncbi:hypothetical protein B0J11DRAFT_224370 [Dendryphion nanum]|uniref:Uncharacterized protein n=1 Tax=Dendryphion nanum TaxID=256645 RepID=A0A9P9E872_9PLEO|nr:hypothetical protein B0J11DRAFT_224370 [Dendryphion nanum]